VAVTIAVLLIGEPISAGVLGGGLLVVVAAMSCRAQDHGQPAAWWMVTVELEANERAWARCRSRGVWFARLRFYRHRA
jgi:hypothetical protein